MVLSAWNKADGLSDGDSRSLGIHPSGDVHGSEFLEEQLRRIGHVHLGDPSLVRTRPTLVFFLG